MSCDVCGPLGRETEVANCDGEPAVVDPPGFRPVANNPFAFPPLELRKCPACSACFLYSFHVPGGSEDFMRTWRVEKLVRATRAGLRRDVTFWLTAWEKKQHLPSFKEAREKLAAAWSQLEPELPDA